MITLRPSAPRIGGNAGAGSGRASSRRLLAALALAATLTGCAGMRPADLYPQLPPNSKFERKITTPWGHTEVQYRTGPQEPVKAP